ncbi:MAG: hypothetical protein FWF06_07525, partial [Symbiobacteriaceae bacterium]|nr:hypothetical protein [Symbiobacteriaceae bacterium]
MTGVNLPAALVEFLQPSSNWIGLFITLCVWSFLYKENPMFRFWEHAYVGTAAGHGIVTNFTNTIKSGVVVNIGQNGEYWEILAIIVGCLIYFQPFRSRAWIAR